MKLTLKPSPTSNLAWLENFPNPPNILPYTHSIRPKRLIRTPPTPLSTKPLSNAPTAITISLRELNWISKSFGPPTSPSENEEQTLDQLTRKWNEEMFGNVRRKRKILLEEVWAFDIIEEERALGHEERMKKAEVLNELERSTLMEEVSLKQKSRVLWLREDDKCTKFFHKVANSNRSKNSIGSLLINGTVSTNRVEISEHIVQFYKELYTEQFKWRPLLDGLSLDSIGEAESICLERGFEEREVLEVVKEMNGDQA